jgi:hypothetical protein
MAVTLFAIDDLDLRGTAVLPRAAQSLQRQLFTKINIPSPHRNPPRIFFSSDAVGESIEVQSVLFVSERQK